LPANVVLTVSYTTPRDTILTNSAASLKASLDAEFGQLSYSEIARLFE
jgi:hypothetical protein